MATTEQHQRTVDRQALMQKIQQQLDQRNAELQARLEYNNRLKAEAERKLRLIDDGSECID